MNIDRDKLIDILNQTKSEPDNRENPPVINPIHALREQLKFNLLLKRKMGGKSGGMAIEEF